MKASDRIARDLRGLLGALTLQFVSQTNWLRKQVEIETDWTLLSDDIKERIRAVATIAVAISDLVQTAVVGDDGAITDAIRRAYDHGQTIAGAAGS